MGYMGFGMRKEVYTRKPRKPFVKLKQLYLCELDQSSNNSNKKLEFAKAQIEAAKSRIRKKIKKEKQKNIFVSILVLLILSVVIWFIVT